MTSRAITTDEIRALHVGSPVARIVDIGKPVEIGRVSSFTPTRVRVTWPSTGALEIAYARETGRRLGCPGEVLRAIPDQVTCECCRVRADVTHGWLGRDGRARQVCATCWEIFDLDAVFADDAERVVTDLGNGAANVGPNDEAQLVETVKADRKRAKAMDAGRWMNEVERYLRERLGWEHATLAEHEALQRACETPGTEPNAIWTRDLERREAPYYTAASLSSWVVLQRSTSSNATTEPDYLLF